MKYAFIVNPASGQGKHGNEIIAQIEAIIAEHSDKDIRIYETRGVKDATVIADCIARETEDDVVVFACGGDGTINEVANGLFGHENAILGVIPVGSGNDFVRAIGGSLEAADKYLDIDAHFGGEIRSTDVLKLSYMDGDEEKSAIAVNGINIGFDGNTAVLAHQLKKLPFVKGSFSYILAAVTNLATKKGQCLKITADGEEFHSGPLLLVTAANGQYCGGGVKSCPRADLYDGLMELQMITDIKRLQFFSLFPKYQKGRIFEVPNENNKLYKYTQAKETVFEPLLGPTMQFVSDGEIMTTGMLKVELVERGLRVLVL